MKSIVATLFIGSLCLLAACRKEHDKAPALDRQQYTFTGEAQCDTITNEGVGVSVSYFLLNDTDAGTKRINDSLQQLATSTVVDWLDSTTIANNPGVRTDLNQAAGLFAADYRAVMQEMRRLSGCWELETKGDTVYSSPKTLTARFETYAYTGGAHPNSNQIFYNFDRDSGRLLNLNELVTDTTALMGIVEKEFRKQQKIAAQTNLEEEGYFLRDGKFFLPTSVGLTRQGLSFYYNPYEIAAYAVGPIEVVVPYEKLNGVLNKDWF
jgi:hypothetical protein